MNRRQVDYRDYQSVATDVRQMHAHGYEKAGQWDLAQICHHLTALMDQSIHGFSFKMPWLVRKLIAPMIKRKIFRTRQIKPGLPAPSSMVASTGLDEAQAVAKFQQQLEQIDQYSGAFEPHPVFGSLSNDQWRQFHLIHISHHLSFVVPRL